MRSVTFRVIGVAQPKGSARAFVPASWAAKAAAAGTQARAVVTSDNPETKGWQQLIREQAQGVMDGRLFDGAIAIAVTFLLPRPVSLPRRVIHHTKKPDLDKLARAVLDGLQGVLFLQDAAVTSIAARKLYAPTGTAPCATITVTEETELEIPLPLLGAAEARA